MLFDIQGVLFVSTCPFKKETHLNVSFLVAFLKFNQNSSDIRRETEDRVYTPGTLKRNAYV